MKGAAFTVSVVGMFGLTLFLAGTLAAGLALGWVFVALLGAILEDEARS